MVHQGSDLSALVGATTDLSLVIDFTTHGGNASSITSLHLKSTMNLLILSLMTYLDSSWTEKYRSDSRNKAPVAINTVNGGNPLGTNATNLTLYNNNDPQLLILDMMVSQMSSA